MGRARLRISANADELQVGSPAGLEPTRLALLVLFAFAWDATWMAWPADGASPSPLQVVIGLVGFAYMALFVWWHVWPDASLRLRTHRVDGQVGSEWLVRRFGFTWDELGDVRLDPVPLRRELRELVLVPDGGAPVHTRVRGRPEELEPVVAAIRERIAAAGTGATDEGAHDRLRDLLSRTRSGASE
jgi:hypothetical protein